MSEQLISFADVGFAFEADRPVLRGCSFKLDAKERLALLGDNGSGKTTLLHLIVGLLRPASGHIEAFGKPRVEEDDFHEVRRRAGLLFQDADDQLFCPTVAEDVAFGPLNLGRSRERTRQLVDETLTRLGLEGYQNRITYRLSGGEKRLVALATVLAMEPDVLLLDEPAGGLDRKSTRRLLDVLLELPQAMIVVSHDTGFLEELTTARMELRDGKISKPDTPGS
jgi:cobalt/nickel transport system ATP-binding protein